MTPENKSKKRETAGAGWFDLPAFESSEAKADHWDSTRGPTSQELRREVQAIRLRNAMDPKRFYRGNNDLSMPKYAQVSHACVELHSC